MVRAGDVLYEAPAEHHLVRNEGSVDAWRSWPRSSRARAGRDSVPSLGGEDEPVRRSGDAVVIDEARISRRLIVRPGDFGTATFTISEVVVAPGAADAWHRHPGAEHAIVVFEGRGLVTVDETTETLEPLTGIRVEPGLTHRVENTGRLPLRYYVCSSPGTDPLDDREPAEAPPRSLDAW